MKKSTKVAKSASPVSDSPAVFMYSEDGEQAGILNLHSSIRPFWDKIKAGSLQAMQEDLFVTTHDKGHTLCKSGANDKVVHIGWINGNAEGKSAFLEKFGKEQIRFSMPTSADDMAGLI